MKKNILIKNVGIVLIFILSVTGCTKYGPIKQNTEKNLNTFETEFINSLNYSTKGNITLIGFKKIKITPQEFEELNNSGKERKINLSNYYYDKIDGSVRIYFPVEDALVEKKDTIIEANKMGELPLSSSQINISDPLYIVGRKQTELVTGVEGNIIRNGIIYLSQKNKSTHLIGNTFVFDFGYKMIMEDNHSEGINETMEKNSCMSNHGKGRNCSTAFNIHNGRCAFNSKVCMDYNGWFTNCKNGKKSNFPGSDCDSALGRGHCWTEIM